MAIPLLLGGRAPRRAGRWSPARLLLRPLAVCVATLAGIVLLWLATAPAATAASQHCSVYWTGATSTAFATATNWASTPTGDTVPDRLPSATDVVCAANSPIRSEIRYTSIGRTVAGIDLSARGDVQPRLIVDGGILRLGSASGAYDSVIHDLQLLSGSVLTGTADYLLTGEPYLSDNAVLDGPGTTTLAPGSEAVTNGLIVDNGRRLLVQGSLTHNGCYDYLYLYNGAVLQNAGRFTVATECDTRVFSDGSDGSRVVNDAGAVLEVSQSPTDRYVLEAQLDNHGTVAVPAGSLVVRPLASSSGSYDLGATGRLLIGAGGALDIGPTTVTGNGTVVLSGGTIDVQAGTVVEAMELLGGTLTGDPTVGSLSGGSASTFTGGGVLTIPAGATASVDGLTVDGGSRVHNLGTFEHVGCAGTLRLRAGSVLENAGSFLAGTSCTSGIQTDGSPGTAVRNAEGAMFTVTQATVTRSYVIAPALDNQGTLAVTRGQATVERTPNLVDGRLSTGTWDAANGIIQFPGPITTNAATISSGAGARTPTGGNALAQLTNNLGTLVVSRTLTVDTDLTNSGDVAVTAQNLYTATYTQLSGTTTVSRGAALASTDNPDSVVIDGGTVSGGGRLSGAAGEGTFEPAGPLLVSAAFKPEPDATLRIAVGPSGSEALTVNGGAFLDGRLAISTSPGFTPATGTTYTVLTAARASGSFTTVSGQQLPGDLYFDVEYGSRAVTLTVRALPLLDIADAAATVGSSGPTFMHFTVDLTPSVAHPLTVDYRTVDGSARAGVDFVAQSGTLTFPPGTTTASVTITILPGTGFEPAETFTVLLSDPQGAALSDDTATGTISHDGDAATIPVVTGVVPDTVGLGAYEAEVSVVGRNFEPTSVVTVTGTEVTVVRTAYVDAETLLVTVNAFGGTTAGSNDVTVSTPGLGADTCVGCLMITAKPVPVGASPALGAGASERTVTVSGSGFTADSSAQFVGGIIVSATSYVSPATLRVTVTVPRVTPVGDYDVRVTNGDAGFGVCPGCFTVVAGPTISSVSPGALARGQTTDVTITGSSFADGAALTPPSGVTVSNVRVVNATTMTAELTVAAGRPRASDLPVAITNPAAAGYGMGTCWCLTVATLISIGDATQAVSPSGPAQMEFVVQLDAPTPQPVTVDYRTVNGTAVAGRDFVGTSGTLTFVPPVTSMTVNVVLNPATAPDPAREFGVVLSDPTNAALADPTATGTITYDPDAGTLPVVTGLSPNVVGPGAVGRELTVSGAHFRPDSTVAVSGPGVTVALTTYVGPSTLRISVNAALPLGASSRDVIVTSPGIGSTICAGCLSISAKPIPAAASPSLAMGATERTVTVTGTGFQSGASALLTGNPGAAVLDTSVVSPTTLRITVTIANVAVVGRYDVRVTNPDGGTGTCHDCFTVTAAPTVLVMTPGVVVRGTTTLATITGTGFVNGAEVVGPDGVTFSDVRVLSPATMTAQMSVAASRPRGSNLMITVVNPAAGGYGEGGCRCLTITV